MLFQTDVIHGAVWGAYGASWVSLDLQQGHEGSAILGEYYSYSDETLSESRRKHHLKLIYLFLVDQPR